jgi:CRP-like cAMP-binding protein
LHRTEILWKGGCRDIILCKVRATYAPQLDLLAVLERRLGRPLPEAARLRQRLVQRSWRRGEALFRVGDQVGQLALIKRGVVKFSYLSAEGVERVRDFIADGQLAVCVGALGGDVDAAYDGLACEDITAETLSLDAVRPLLQREPLWAQCLNLLLHDITHHLAERERMLLTLSPPERLAQAVAERPWLRDRVPQQDLAAYIGITPVSLSRLKARERRRGGAAAARRLSAV